MGALRFVFVAILTFWAGLALAQDGKTDLSRLLERDLPVRTGSFDLYYSPSAKTEAEIYAKALEGAVAWYRGKTGWTGKLVMAVLNAEDWAAVSENIPYPSPYAENKTGLVMMPDRIDGHPGFDQWDLEPVGLNAALTFHEIGHVIASSMGLWSSNYWVNELVANAFLAAYVRAERPEFAGLLNGVPPRFTDFGTYTALIDFDDIYFAMGQLNYAWFQFKLAALADYLVSDQDFATVFAGLMREFPDGAREHAAPLEDTLAQLETIKPGFTERAADILKPSALPLIARQPCGPDVQSNQASVPLVVENRSSEPIALVNIDWINFEIGILMLRDKIPPGTDMDALVQRMLMDEQYADVFQPGQRFAYSRVSRLTQWHIIGRDCFVVPDGPGRLVYTGD